LREVRRLRLIEKRRKQFKCEKCKGYATERDIGTGENYGESREGTIARRGYLTILGGAALCSDCLIEEQGGEIRIAGLRSFWAAVVEERAIGISEDTWFTLEEHKRWNKKLRELIRSQT
jgi:hypothetical protein